LMAYGQKGTLTMPIMCEDCKCSIWLEDKPNGTREYGGCDNGCSCCNDYPETDLTQYNWVKYTFICDPNECDALLEFTARDGYGFPNGVVRMYCPCGREMQYIEVEDVKGPLYEPVIKVTPPRVVKINSNPYN
jgi:hypothetical protein